jgi:hypothetical protein
MTRRVTVTLTEDEAIVLYAWLSRIDESDSADFADQAEQRLLWDLIAMLETQIDSVLSAQYQDEVAIARSRVRDPVE